jgi:hypothetical protein
MMVIEQVVERVAATVGRRPEEVRAANFYEEGAVTHYGQVLERNQVGCLIIAHLLLTPFKLPPSCSSVLFYFTLVNPLVRSFTVSISLICMHTSIITIL